MKHKNSPSFLKLQPEELQIIAALKNKNRLTPTELSLRAGVKRTTVNFLLKKLADGKKIKATSLSKKILALTIYTTPGETLF